jgi:hypothetical protein
MCWAGFQLETLGPGTILNLYMHRPVHQKVWTNGVEEHISFESDKEMHWVLMFTLNEWTIYFKNYSENIATSPLFWTFKKYILKVSKIWKKYVQIEDDIYFKYAKYQYKIYYL